MNKPGSINTKRLIITAGAFIILSAVLLFWARDVIRELVVNPISYLVWLFGILIRVTPQIFFWLSLLVISLMIAYRSVSAKRKVYAQLPGVLPEQATGPASSGRVEYWANKVHLMRNARSAYFQSTFHLALNRLLINLLAHRYRVAANQVEERVREGWIDLPPDIREYLLEGSGPRFAGQGSFWYEIWQNIVEWFRSLFYSIWYANRAIPAAAEEQRVIRILEYIEGELEVQNDNAGR